MWLWLTSVNVLMHHSIPAAPCPLSPDNYEASARLVPGAGHLPTLGASPKNLSTPLKVRFLTFNMYFNLKSLISKQIVRACIDCQSTVTVRNSPHLIHSIGAFHVTTTLVVFWWLSVFYSASVCNSCQYHWRLIASFEFQKMWIGPQNMLQFLDKTTMIK